MSREACESLSRALMDFVNMIFILGQRQASRASPQVWLSNKQGFSFPTAHACSAPSVGQTKHQQKSWYSPQIVRNQTAGVVSVLGKAGTGVLQSCWCTQQPAQQLVAPCQLELAWGLLEKFDSEYGNASQTRLYAWRSLARFVTLEGWHGEEWYINS